MNHHLASRLLQFVVASCSILIVPQSAAWAAGLRPHIVLVMADDQGWGQTGYYGHPFLQTPNLDEMARRGLRFDRFYAGGPVCSPTRATVLTGRTHERTGVPSHGHALRLQERTLPAALAAAGYSTAHFGKWHLDGVRGPGVPILPDDPYRPDIFGFTTWLSVTNFFDRDPLMGRSGRPAGDFEQLKGDSSEVIVAAAIRHLEQQLNQSPDQPTFTVIWFGSPHAPWQASEQDQTTFAALPIAARHHYGELVAMDRSIGRLRTALRELGIAEDTLLWFTSDNGGLPNAELQPTVGQNNPELPGMTSLRGFKGSLYEGGLRVPAIIEWPGRVQPRVTSYPAGAVDIFPTIADLAGLPSTVLLPRVDGISLVSLFDNERGPRRQPLGFRCFGWGAWIDNEYKLVIPGPPRRQGRSNQMRVIPQPELYNLVTDPAESSNCAAEKPEKLKRLLAGYEAFSRTVDASIRGEDYPEGHLTCPDPVPIRWNDADSPYRQFNLPSPDKN